MKRIFDGLYNNDHCGDTWKAENLYATALKFRLLRQHRYVSLKVFMETEKKKKKKGILTLGYSSLSTTI